MDWYDIDDTLLDGTKSEIEALRCPDCGGEIYFRFSTSESSDLGDLRVFCNNCNQYEALHKIPGVPNCVKYFGKKKVLGGDSDG